MKQVIAFCVFALAAGCGDNNVPSTGVDASGIDAPDGSTVVRSTLSGFQEVPAVYADARGSAVLTINKEKTEIDVDLSYTGLTGITAAHIHVGKPGINGEVIFTLASADFASPLDTTLTATDFTAAGGIATFADAVQAILDGNTYINIHTTAEPGGALRGHVGKASLVAVASGAQETASVTTTATGTVMVEIDAEQDSIQVTFDSDGLTDATAAHIHAAEVGRDGPVIFALATAAPVADPLTKTVTATDLMEDASAGVANMNDAVDAILSGRAYFNVHTTANAGGELRAQLGAVNLRASLTPGQETSAVVGAANAEGRSFVTISGDQSTITMTTTFDNVGTTTVAHIHAGALGAAGPPIFTLASAAFTSPLANTLTEAEFTAAGGITTFTGAIDAILAGNTYVNLHTATNTAGEIRGQIGRATLTATLNNASEVPPVVPPTGATAEATVRISGDQRTLTVTGTYDMLDDITAAHIHSGDTITNGPVIFPLAGATFDSPFTFTLTSEDLMTATGIQNMADAIGAILDELTYINIHTTANTGGEVRGQITAP